MLPAQILVVEDERLIAKNLQSELKKLGHTVVGLTFSGEEAVRQAVALKPDLILMDINLGGGMDGVEAAALIRQQTDAPIVFLTAFSDEATLQRAKVTEPHGYVLKPYTVASLQTAIEIGLYKNRADRLVRENEQWLAATLGSIGGGVIATDESGRVRLLNSLAEQMTGWSQADAFGRDVREVFEIVEERSREPVPNPALEALAKGYPTALAPNTVLIAKGGIERPIDDSASPIRGANGKVSGSVLVFRDITERRRLEEHLRQAQKMEAIGRLAGGIAHDFNNIMTVIIGYGELLRAENMSAEQRLATADVICDAGNRAAALTQQIMAFSRKQMLVPSVLNLNTVVRDMGAMVRRLIGEHIEFVAVAAPDLGRVKADPTQVGQVILNLAANARDAMPGGGRLVFATANTVLGEEVTRLHPDVKAGLFAQLSVSDSGSGMSAEVSAQVFEPFFTTKGVGQGTGLGLATVYGIVKQSGGHIDVTSQLGAGTTFRIYLPLVDEPTPQAGAGAASQPARGNETVLLVEDEDGVRKLTRLVLEQSGYTVLEAADGLDAIRVAEQHQGVIHLLLTDLMMPHLSGREVAERLTPLRPGMRVLYMSGYTEDVIVHHGVETATAECLHKPFSLAALTNKVRNVLDRNCGD